MTYENNSLEQKISDVAVRIKSLREDVGINAEEMAAKLDLPLEEYLSYESGQKDFSFTFIYKVAGACGVEITDLMEGQSPILREYTVTRKGMGTPIVRRQGFSYQRLAPLFKNKIAEPFYVKIPYSEELENGPAHYATHKGQELDIVISGSMRITVGGNSEVLNEGDSIYYDSSLPHDEVALDGKDCEIYAIVMNTDDSDNYSYLEEVVYPSITNVDKANLVNPVYEKWVETSTDAKGVILSLIHI